MYVMGVDIGSTSCKAVIMDQDKNILAKTVIATGTGTSGPKRVVEDVLALAGLSAEDVSKTVATGYGRIKFTGADKQVSEISCHGRGVFYLMPQVRTIIDIGGQDAKAMRLNDKGKVFNFVMNDKCAAGTGRFLDVIAKVLELRTEDLAEYSAKAKEAVSISSTCTVFAESEVISHLSNGIPVEDIVLGIHDSVARRVAGLAQRLGIAEDVAMSGGVALNGGVVEAMSRQLGVPVHVHPDCQLAGAIGAAIYAVELL